MKAYKSAKESANGGNTINSALKLAANVPLGVAERVVEVARDRDFPAADHQPEYEIRPDHSDRSLQEPHLKEPSRTSPSIWIQSSRRSPEDEAFVSETRQRAAALKA